MEKYTIEDVLNRMYNWKAHSAFEYAKNVDGFPQDAIIILEELSDKYGNCGWSSGSAFDELVKKNNEVAKLLGYVWDDNEDFWVKK